MSQTFKNRTSRMGHRSGPRQAMQALLMAAALAAGGAGFASADEAAAGRITVTGEGRVDTVPDMATVSLGITSAGATAAEAMAANSAELARVLANLEAAGITGRDVQTTGLSLNPDWRSEPDGTGSRIAGFVAGNSVTVRLRALDRVGTVLDVAIRDGANTLNGLNFGLQDPAPAEAEARRRAVADAKARAELLAGAAGVTLGAIRTIAETQEQAAPGPLLRMAAESAVGGVPVEGGEVSTRAFVTIVWDIAP